MGGAAGGEGINWGCGGAWEGWGSWGPSIPPAFLENWE